MTENISYDCKCKFTSTTCNSNQKWNNEMCQCKCENYCMCKKDYSWNPSTFICENRKYLKIIANTSVIECDEIISVMDNVSTKMTNTIARNVTKNCHSKKARYKFDCYNLDTVSLVIILLLKITINHSRTCYYFDDIIKLEDFDCNNILIDENPHENILMYNILYRTLIGPKPLCIRFDKIDGFIRIYDGTRYLVLFGPEL